MSPVLRCPSLLYLAAALLSIGCSRHLTDAPKAPAAILKAEETTPSQGITKTWVRDVGNRPLLQGQIERETTIDTSLSCVQWVTLSDGSVSADALEFHRAACPNDETALGENSLAFRAWIGAKEAQNGADQYTLFDIRGEQTVDVGKLQLATADSRARLEELCQFTNGVTTAPFASACTITELSQSWGELNPPASLTSQPTNPVPESETPVTPETEESLARR